MSSTSFKQSMRRLWALDKFSYSVRVFIALTGSMALCWYQDEMTLLIPLFLGIIASALAETDDSWQGRLNALAVTLVCFSIAALSVELLFPYPWIFAVALAVASFGLTMLGALGERYGAIASATLILSVYTMIGVDQRGGAVTDFWHEPLLLVAGAAWYGVLSVLWQALFSNQPVQQSLARLFRELGRYLKLKSSLFEPIRQLDVEARRLELAQQNGRVVAALNAAKEIILHRVGNGRPGSKVSRYLKLYFLAQDIHERASSSHYPYNALTEAFFHSDVLFRCQRLLRQQGKACQTLAESIQLRQPFIYDDSFAQALGDLNASLEHLRIQSNPAWRGLLRSLRALAANLSTLDRLLGDASNPDALADATDSNLLDRAPRNLKEMWTRLRTQLTPTSLLFRHALRLSLALTVGYATLHAIHASQGYWIILTTLFVCQPSYGATRRKLGQRIIGTAIGLTVAWALFDLFPNPVVQSMFAIAAGLVFFINRTTRYTLATAAITLMVLFCFNQVGDGYGLFLPRLFDTLLGSLIAGLAVFLFLPDWQGRRLNKVLANTLTCNSIYLRQIMQQYAAGKSDDLAYRLARRNAHNADAALSTTLANMLMEPGHFRKEADVGFRFLVLSHTLLSYLSGLGAHRDTQLPTDVREHLIEGAGNSLATSIDEIATGLANKQPIAIQSDAEEGLAAELEQMPDEIDEAQRLVQTQLALICRQLGPLRTLAAHLIKETGAA
ncbi:MAG: TIGR01666 family membrane protein [Pseudomonadales bacterium RIFCSPLOWO2_12_60_38]|uniref:TIGR01666 family membrane protein n=1 Tax=Pseudomonas paracarnis TaxID=2750625 RepID=A0ABU6BUS8_9PSED|nr:MULTISPECIES: YccS family putative transporter [Pseudomonas]AOS76124.1 TIGR01666 family membrane protein [Pseudomonas fluorescens]ETK42418.1 YccS/YhfK family integral membrane protein [Pseudomonas fluorescens FH5]MDN5596927.1 YccS family putative transporter [Pseudomonas sp.]OHC31088.1 MAG: TIGR01666 family membrane protein [Pseudomonadales bacterium RIFCSPLOWO2_12_60_38]OHC39898.1 MAG: TIGR01666 family membrane protein [Pseudomonadales bacterium RIFCSPLOWO2_12_FULL_59_450]